MDSPFSSVLTAALIAVTPAALTWWQSRHLIPLVDDPALPERLAAAGHRRRIVSALAVVAGILLTGWHLRWATLVEIRVAAAGVDSPVLVVVDGRRRRWTIPLRSGDLPRIQTVLDGVDGRLAKPVSAGVDRTRVSRVAAAALAVAALIAAQWAAAMTAAIAFVRPSPRLLAAASVGALVSTLIGWRNASMSGDGGWIAAAIALGLACVAAVMAWRRRAEVAVAGDNQAIVLLGAVAVVACGLFAIYAGTIEPLRLSRTARLWPAAAVLLCALGSVMSLSGLRRPRVAGALLIAGGLVHGFVGSRTFLDRFARDPLLVDVPSAGVVVVDAAPAAEFDLPVDAHRLKISPDGRYLAAFTTEGNATRIHIGPTAGPLSPFAADDIEFLGGDEAVLLTRGRGASNILELSLGLAPSVRREHPVAGMWATELLPHPETGRWRAVAWDDEELVAIDSAGAGPPRETRWHVVSDTGDLQPVAIGPDGPILVETRYDAAAVGGGLWRLGLPFMLSALDSETALWVDAREARREIVRSRLEVHCATRTAAAHAACSAFDGITTRYVNVGTTTVEPVLELPGEFLQMDSAPGWVTGWWRHVPTAIRLATRQAFRIASSDRLPVQLAAGDHVIAALTYGSGRQTVRLYPLR